MSSGEWVKMDKIQNTKLRGEEQRILRISSHEVKGSLKEDADPHAK